MSVGIRLDAFAGKDSAEFKKHYGAVVFCIDNKLSFPKETSEFFKGKVGGDNLEDISTQYILEYIENGITVDVPTEKDNWGNFIKLKVKDIPPEVDTIIFSLS